MRGGGGEHSEWADQPCRGPEVEGLKWGQGSGVN